MPRPQTYGVDLEHENAQLRSALSAVTTYLDQLLSGAKPPTGRSNDAKNNTAQWWEERLSAVKLARALLED